MDPIRQQLQRMQDALAGLSASQKMLTASLMAIMVMTLAYWVRFAGSAEMVPLLDQPTKEADATQIIRAVREAGISDVRLAGDRVMVPAERHAEALAAASWARVLPADSISGFDEMIKQIGPFETEAKTGAMLNRGREMTLARMIQTYPGVAKASVIISDQTRRQIGGRGDITPSATVNVETRPGSDGGLIKRMVEASAASVASATPGLTPARVSVIVDGRKWRTNDDGENFSGEVYEQIAQQERHFSDKISGLLMPNALVAVKATIDTVSVREQKTTYDAKGTFAKESSILEDKSETAQPTGAGEPGAQANIGLGPEVLGPGPNSTTSTEKTKTDMQIFPSGSVQTIDRPAGSVTVVGAAVRLPLSHFVSRYKATSGFSSKDPDEITLKPMIDAEVQRTKEIVMRITGLNSEEAVSVDPYWDTMPLLAATEISTTAGVGTMFTSHVKEIAVGALALISLFMVSMMVRKGAPAPIVVPPPELHEVPALATEEDVAGEVGEGGSLLDGMELDEDAIKAQQMLDQVSTLVKENPDGAANLVKRWLNK